MAHSISPLRSLTTRSLHHLPSKRLFTSSPSPARWAPTIRAPLRSRALYALAGSLLLFYSLYELKPELLPSLPTVHAEAPKDESFYLDPTTQTPFNNTFLSPSGKELKLLGTGVRVVSFLGIRVYTAGIYVSKEALKDVQNGRVDAFKNYSPSKLIPPFSAAGEGEVVGEALIGKLVHAKYDFAVVIIPLRNTSLTHLRDAFARALVSRLKLPQVTSALTPEENEEAATALSTLQSFFPARALLKGHALNVFLSNSEGSLQFSLPDAKNPSNSILLGTLLNPVLARQMLLSYFSDSASVSEELRESVARGLAGELR